MSMSSVMIVSIAAAIILIVGGGLVMYMAGLVKNAYELKVQIAADIDERLGKMADDLDKKSRWIKRDLLEEIDKIKTALETDNARKFEALSDPISTRIEELEQMLRKGHADLVKAIEADREAITKFDAKIGALRRELKQVEGGAAGVAPPAGPTAAPEAPQAPAADMDPVLLAATVAAKAAVAAAQQPVPPRSAASPAKPATPMSGVLPNLGAKKN